MYDWANSVFMTSVILVFPIYFSKVAAAGLPAARATSLFGWTTTVAMTITALMGPPLGALADFKAMKKGLLAGFLVLGVMATAALALVGPGDWRLGCALFVVANVGIASTLVFYESLLPHICSAEEIDRVSSAGYAVGYLGGGIPLVLNLWWIQQPRAWGFRDADEAIRFGFLFAAAWWAVFSIPLFRRVAEPARVLEADETAGENPLRAAFTRLGETLRELRVYRQAFLFLLAFVVYNDGINTIIRMATIYGTELGIGQGSMIGALVAVQLVGVPFSFLFGAIAGRIGTRPAIQLCVSVFVLISVVGYFMTTAVHFWALSLLVGTVLGGSQALSRSLFASLVPRHKSSEFFGFYSVFEKFAGIVGPMIFASVVSSTGSSRNAILSLVAFFVIGGFLLSRVDVAAGQEAARRADAV
jgi:UMF1 family MFS transporter